MDPNSPLQLRDQLSASPTLRLVALGGHVVSQRFSRIFGGQDGLSPSGAAVLGVIAWGTGRGVENGTPGRATHAELARRCMITPATLTGVVNTLVKAGYLRRVRDTEDRRVVWLVLTEAGQERTAKLNGQVREMAGPLMCSVPPEHEAIIRGFLIDLVCRLTTTDDGSPRPGEPGEHHGDGQHGDGHGHPDGHVHGHGHADGGQRADGRPGTAGGPTARSAEHAVEVTALRHAALHAARLDEALSGDRTGADGADGAGGANTRMRRRRSGQYAPDPPRPADRAADRASRTSLPSPSASAPSAAPADAGADAAADVGASADVSGASERSGRLA